MNEYKIGQLVRLKGTNMPMTISDLSEYYNPSTAVILIECVWFDIQNNLNRYRFPLPELEHIENVKAV